VNNEYPEIENQDMLSSALPSRHSHFLNASAKGNEGFHTAIVDVAILGVETFSTVLVNVIKTPVNHQ